MKSITKIGTIVALTLCAATSAYATSILDVSGAVLATDPTQMGRLFRNGTAQDWAGTEAFPGATNQTIAYHYVTYLVNVGITPYIQISFDSVSTATFVSAYDTSYQPGTLGFATNWLGDAGTSGNFFGVDPLFFQVVVPENHDLVIVINTTAPAPAGLGDPFHLIVEGFIDTEYTDPPSTDPGTPVPEPSTLLLTGSGLGLVALKRRTTGPRGSAR